MARPLLAPLRVPTPQRFDYQQTGSGRGRGWAGRDFYFRKGGSTNEKSLLNRMVDKTSESAITIKDHSVKALIDTGSDITTIGDKCYFSMDPRPELRSMSDFKLNIQGASGSSIPCIGYFEAEVCMPESEHEPAIIPILVVPVMK